MNEFEVYKLYLGIKNHFNIETYDYFQYHGKVKANPSSFEKRKDKFFFVKLSKHPDPRGFILANFLKNGKTWSGFLAREDEAEKIYREWLRTQNSLMYLFKNDLDKLDPDFKQNFYTPSNEHPKILKLVSSSQISLESFILIVDITNTFSGLTRKLNGDIVWSKYAELFKKYRPFLNYNKETVKKVIIEHFDLAVTA